MNKLSWVKSSIILSATLLFSSCGGGGSDSGGAAPAPTLLVATYQGSYNTDLFNGSIAVSVDERTGRGSITLTGTCLPDPINLAFGFALNGYVSVGGNIPETLNPRLNIPGFISVSFPLEGGVGEISLDAGSCGSTVGTLSVTRT